MGELESVPGAGVLVDEDHIVVDANNPCQVVFNTEIEQIRGESLGSLWRKGLLSESVCERWKRAVSAVVDGADARTERVTLRPGDGDDGTSYDLRVRPASTTGAVSCSLRSVGTRRGYDETITALHVSTRELMTADEVEEVLKRTAEAANDVLGFPGTAVRRHDEQAGLLHHVGFGGRVADIDSRPSFDAETSPHGRALRRGETVIDTVEPNDPYDREQFTQTMYTPIGDTGLLSIGTVGRIFDETDVRFAEILAENAAAAIRVVETTARLRDERERLDRFASVISHDLRNPLEVSRLYLDRARETGDPSDFDTVAGGLERMEQMIDDLLTLARSRTTISNPEPAILGEIVRNAWETVQPENDTVVFETTVDQRLSCDPTLLGNLFENLLRNAVEHNEQPLQVRVGPLEPNDRVVGFYVADDGEGIPESERESVLEHGYTTGSGTGLGLSIVCEIVDAHGWELELTESRDGGARFEIRTTSGVAG